MKRVITPRNRLNEDEFEIDDIFYDQAVKARRNLFDSASLEEKFDIVMENFNEYEECLLSLASQYNIFRNLSNERFNQNRSLLNRRIINLFSSAKMYTDQAIVFFKQDFGRNSEELNRLQSFLKTIRSENLGFKVCEYLRNYTQHFDLPINALYYRRDHVEDDEETFIGESIIPYIKLVALSEDNKFPDVLQKELRALTNGKDGFDIRPLIRHFIHGLGQMHHEVRLILQPSLSEWEGMYARIFDFAKEKSRESTFKAIGILSFDNSDNLTEVLDFDYYVIEHRKYLVQKNISQNNTHIVFVTSQTKKTDFGHD
jgi:hypothetical protein